MGRTGARGMGRSPDGAVLPAGWSEWAFGVVYRGGVLLLVRPKAGEGGGISPGRGKKGKPFSRPKSRVTGDLGWGGERMGGRSMGMGGNWVEREMQISRSSSS